MRNCLQAGKCPTYQKGHYWSLSNGVPVILLFFSFFLSLPGMAQKTVTGKVTAGDSALLGVTVQVKGTTTATQTNNNGNFSISAPADATLVFTYIGYNIKEVKVGNQSNLDVSLVQGGNQMNEIVVVGYSTQKKATLTGSISEVKGAELVKSPQPNLSNSLAGRFSGVIINNRSGEPGYDASNITIRGLATTGNNDVLVVVDGVPGQIGGLDRLDPNDVESVTVLKDASAAIYGNRAANGVILVTTKRGKTGKPSITYSFNQGFSSPTRLPKMADAATYAQIMNEIYYYASPTSGMNQAYSEAQIQKFRDGSDPLNYPNTDWIDAALKKVALQNRQNLAINGGTENVKYFLSLGTVYQDGIYKHGVADYHQYNFRSNVDANVTKRFKASLSLSGRQENRMFPAYGAGDIFRSIYRAKPIVAPYYPNGLPTTGIENNNPVMQVTDVGGTVNNPTQVFNGILKGSYTIPGIEGLSVDGFYAVDVRHNFTKGFYTPYNLYSYNAATGSYSTVITGGSAGKATLNESQTNQTLTTSNIKLNYIRQFGSHNINAFVGYEQSKTNEETFGASRLNFPTTQTPELSQGGTAATDKNNSGSSYNFTRRSIISRLAYNFEEKYLVEGQLRIDGSSTFAPGNQYGYFPSISAGYRISKEDWFKNNIINDLKLRASYGSLGNDNVGLFQYYENYAIRGNYVLGTSGGNSIIPGIDLIKLANPEITWEVAKKMDIGFNAAFLKNFNIELIYFQQKRSDILANRNASLPATSGIVNPYGSDPLVPSENMGKVNSNGFEGTLGYNHPGKINWGASGNFTYAKSKVIFIDEAAATLAHQRVTGGPLNTYLLYNAIGIFRTQADLDKYPHVSGAKVGDLIFEDYNKDNKITADDQVRTNYGNIPELTYGLNLYADYNGFDLSVVLAGQSRVSQYVLPEAGSVGNFYSSWADNRWSPSNPDGSYPKVSDRASSAISGGLYNNTFWLNDASFLRLKNVELGYNVRSALLNRIKISGVRLYASAFNLFTISKVKDYDPEGNSGSGQFYPQQRILNLGANVKF
ncbi:TonB-dependent receptor [Chitinophagaceae bacterium LB-8]|uniref:TonB-dependent receptor n=1 Tax=Paraflavisolibacter caeni TaxID=2982496 RepID=A0A9X3BFT5_9BACT|nr:TonB-dependent receptor [Paraflavisolibacter caeni]MCU7549609.1 TonB-dependent receptor [Paraflavisolibacter caeni]